jgi:integrase/recombinase XerD
MVTLRVKPLSANNYHLFVDVYENGQRSKQYLKLYVSEDYTQPVIDKYKNIVFDSKGAPKAKKVKAQDKANWELACKVKTEIENKLNKGNFGFDNVNKGNGSFTDYFAKYVTNYNKKDKRKADACLAQFKDYNDNRNVLFSAINEDYSIGFKEYLETNLKGETPCNYFKVFKAVVKKAHKEEFLKTNYAEDVTIKKINAIRKDVLTFTEINKLFNTPANNEQVKRAFLFSCLTGTRFVDTIKITWNNVKATERGLMLSFTQSKTGKDVSVELNEDAIKLLGERRENKDYLFTLPSHTGVLKSLRTWVKKAGITKHVTYHVARHSFGTNLVFYGADVKSASELLGHSNFNQTNLYVRASDSLKQKAVNQLPKFS